MDLIPYSRQSIIKEDISMIEKVMESDFLTQGPKVPEFEEQLKNYFNVEYAVACSSGTSALHIGYAGIGINQKSLGIVPAITFAATANALRYEGANVQFCDVEPETGLISIESLEECLAKVPEEQLEQKNLIAPVSFAGSVPDLKSCRKLADKKNFFTVEDASHSPGAWYENKSGERTYSLSGVDTHASTLSFHPVKHLCCGEGGALLTNHSEIANKAENLRSHGIHRPNNETDERPWFYEQINLGWNYRLTDIQAALGISQIKRLDHFLEKRRHLAEKYETILNQEPFSNFIRTPEFHEGNAWHLYIIQFLDKELRDAAYKFFKQNNILTQVHYIPVYKHPYYRNLMGEIKLPGAEKYFERCLSIPLFPDLTEEKQKRVIHTLEKFLSHK